MSKDVSGGINMKCPKCGSENVQAVVQQNVTGKITDNRKTKEFGWCKGCFTSLILGPFGWLCGLCGMGKTKGKFKDNRKVTNEVVYCCLECGKQFKK